jgi:hypothetical protein
MDAGACSCPKRFQLDRRLIHPLPFLETEELFLVKGLLVFEHEIDGTAELVGEDREGLGLAVLTGQPLEILFPGLIALEEKDGSLGEGPLEMSVTDLFTTGAVFFAVGFFDTLNETAVGDEILDRGEAVDGIGLIEEDQAEDSADSRNGLKQGIGSEVVIFGTDNDIPFEVSQEEVIGSNDLQINSHAFLDGKIVEAIDDAFSVLGFRDASQGLREVVLASGVLDMGKEFRPFSHEVISASEEVPGCPHLCGIDISLRNHTASE